MAEKRQPKPEKRKPKLSNQPTPKEPKKKGSFLGKVVTIISLVVIGFALFTMKQHADNTQKAPWAWDGSDWVDYLTFSRRTAEDVSNDIKDRVNEVDWEAIRAQITEKTEKLWNSAKDLEKRIETRLDQEKNKRVAEVEPETPKPSGDTSVQPKPKPKPQKKGNYQKGLEAMKRAMRKYRNSPPGSKAAKKNLEESERSFREAQNHLQRAIDEVPSHQKPDVEDMLQECQQYLYDCQKRKTL